MRRAEHWQAVDETGEEKEKKSCLFIWKGRYRNSGNATGAFFVVLCYTDFMVASTLEEEREKVVALQNITWKDG